ncbi:MAG: type II toxin-antitoxin system HicA family toxin [Acidiferrobacteraceae bacterium]
MHSRDLIRWLEAAGWRRVRVRGSHHQFKHQAKTRSHYGAAPEEGLGTGLVRAILKQAGVRPGDR